MSIIVCILVSFIALFPANADVTENQAAPVFVLTGLDKHQHSLTDLRGKPTVLFFFCGCAWCHDTARQWALSQRAANFKVGSNDHQTPRTMIVYSGIAADGIRFEKQSGLDQASTLMVLDRYMTVSTTLYDAEPCPRVFVLSSDQQVLYTNDHNSDAPRTISGKQLIDRVYAVLSSLPTEKFVRTTPSTKINPEDAVNSTTDVYLTPLAGTGTSVEGAGVDPEAHYDFGTVKQSNIKTIEHVFQFRNDTSSPIIVDHIQPSCGCTNAFIGNTADYPVTINPGQTVPITTYVDLTDLYPASVEKSVMIFRTGQITPIGMVEITGNLTQ